jgi:hypothetical protein
MARVELPLRHRSLLRLEQEDCAVPEVEVDEMLCFCRRTSVSASCWPGNLEVLLTVRDKAAKVATDYAMPSLSFLLIKL